jgi:hypothetical protein
MQLWREVGDTLRNERKRGESLIDCLNRIVAEAREWRKLDAFDTSTPEKFGDTLAAAIAIGREMMPGEGTVLPAVMRLLEDAYAWRKLGASKPEPSPQNQDGPALWPLVIADLENESDPIYALVAKDALERHGFGISKYGVPLVAHNGRNHLKDAYQEQLDKLVYLRAHYECTGLDQHAYKKAIRDAVELRRALEAQ